MPFNVRLHIKKIAPRPMQLAPMSATVVSGQTPVFVADLTRYSSA